MKRLLAISLTLLMASSNSWALLAEGRTGSINSSNGAVNAMRTGRTGETITADGHARYQEAVLNGNVYIGGDLGGTSVTTQAGLSIATPALTLYNPVGSGVYLVVLAVDWGVTAAPAAAAEVMLAYNVASATAPAATTLANVANALVGTMKLPIGQCYRVATLAAAPLALRYLWGTTGAAAIGGTTYTIPIDGTIILSPGVALSIQTTSAMVGTGAITWEEVPL